jgi:Cys-tRNA(Pro)/Cys-tRNA(Cys) deacylase
MSEAIPVRLRAELLEARVNLRAGAYTSAGVMVRRLLEGVCADHGISRGSLYGALGELRRRGLIEGRLLGWAQDLREIGNEAAHMGPRRIARQDAEDAVALAEALLDYLYVFARTYNAFRERRGGGTTAARSSSLPRRGRAPRDTAAVKMLKRSGVAFRSRTYPADPGRTKSRKSVADLLGIPQDRMFKAVIAYVDGHVVVAVAPVTEEIDLNALAAATGGREARIADPGDVRGQGAVSPLGLQLRIPAVVDAAALAVETICVSGGRPGLELEVAPADLIRVIEATTAAITRHPGEQ